MGEVNTTEEKINSVSGAVGQAKISQGTNLPPIWGNFTPRQKAAVQQVSLFVAYESPTNTALSVNFMYATPFWLPQRANLDLIGFDLTVNGTAGAMLYLGIYDDTNWYPNALKIDAGTIIADAGAPAVKTLVINLTLDAGIYWLVHLGNNATTQGAIFDHVLQYRMISPYQGYRVAQAYGALPANFPGGAVGNPVWYMNYEVSAWG